jgi:hypothetical protein
MISRPVALVLVHPCYRGFNSEWRGFAAICICPHWLVGILVPVFVGGLIVTIIAVIIPYCFSIKAAIAISSAAEAEEAAQLEHDAGRGFNRQESFTPQGRASTSTAQPVKLTKSNVHASNPPQGWIIQFDSETGVRYFMCPSDGSVAWTIEEAHAMAKDGIKDDREEAPRGLKRMATSFWRPEAAIVEENRIFPYCLALNLAVWVLLLLVAFGDDWEVPNRSNASTMLFVSLGIYYISFLMPLVCRGTCSVIIQLSSRAATAAGGSCVHTAHFTCIQYTC